MELNRAIQSRRSIRKFKYKKPDWRDIIECIDAVRYAPMAGNNFTVRAILVDDLKKIQKIAEACQQSFVGETKYVVVICSDPTRPENAYGERGKIFTRQQAGAAIQNFLLKIEESGLATCWVGYFAEDIIKRELKIPEKVHVEGIFPIGYGYLKPKKRFRTELDGILYFNTYKNKKMKPIRKMDV